MILKNAKFYTNGLIHEGIIYIKGEIIKKILFEPKNQQITNLSKKNQDGLEIDCQNKLILPGIIDIHSHLRDLDQSEKETFLTGTKAAAFSGITTVFNMPNTNPPAISFEKVSNWMEKAEKNIHVDVGFIAGVPKSINEEEIKKIIELGVIGFKIYPHDSLNDIDWKDSSNLQIILKISSRYQFPIFIHASYPIPETEKKLIEKEFNETDQNSLILHSKLDPVSAEQKFVQIVIDNYKEYINANQSKSKDYPIIHFCHISCIESFLLIEKAKLSNKSLKITFEVTPHHLLLNNSITLENENFGKVLPPLREKKHSKFLFNKLTEGTIEFIGTDHAPHTLEEKSQTFLKSPSGFPGFETYPLLLINKIFDYELPLDFFVKVASENPAKTFNLNKKGFIKEGYDADLIIVDKVPEYKINSQNFKTKAKFSPFENFISKVQICKVFLRGKVINIENNIPSGKIIKHML
ncbi:MAG: dihydroorotase family protein [Promethearchaeota archaeon]